MDGRDFSYKGARGHWKPKKLIRYLLQRLLVVNNTDCTMPLDKWFGSFHDGSTEADEFLNVQRLKLDQRRVATKENQ